MLGQRYRLVEAFSFVTGDRVEFYFPVETPKLDDRSFEAAMIRARIATRQPAERRT